jgi:hypothetical protein
LVSFNRWIGPCGDAFDCWVFAADAFDCWVHAGVPAVVLVVVLRRSLYVIYSTCLPPYDVVSAGASCHCERCLHAVRACFLAFRRGRLGLLDARSWASHAAWVARLALTVRVLRCCVVLSFRCVRFRDGRGRRDLRGELAKRGFFFPMSVGRATSRYRVHSHFVAACNAGRYITRE